MDRHGFVFVSISCVLKDGEKRRGRKHLRYSMHFYSQVFPRPFELFSGSVWNDLGDRTGKWVLGIHEAGDAGAFMKEIGGERRKRLFDEAEKDEGVVYGKGSY